MFYTCIRLIEFPYYQGIKFKSAKKRKGMLVAFVSFDTAEQVKSAVQVLLLACL